MDGGERDYARLMSMSKGGREGRYKLMEGRMREWLSTSSLTDLSALSSFIPFLFWLEK